MYLDGTTLVLSPTDLTKHLACAHLTVLDLQVARGTLPRPDQTDESLELIFRLGNEHEKAYLQRLKDSGRDVVEIPNTVDLASQVALTNEALHAGAEVIYQATFLHDGHRGHADFLLRTDDTSDLGAWSYDVADTKLARKLKVAALLQMADYGRHLQRLQGRPPEWLTVVTGDQQERRYLYRDVAAYATRATERLIAAIEAGTPTEPEPTGHCEQCRWSPRCESQWRRSDHLSLVAFMRTDHRHLLEAAGITTVAALAATDPVALPVGIGESSRIRLQDQAALQISERTTGSPIYRLLDPEPGLGLLRLPEPHPADLYLDFEGDPYAEGGDGREYLAGIWDRDEKFTTFWAHSFDEEGTLTADLLSFLVARLDANPGMHVYHYAPYERTALARLTQRHGVGEINFDRLLRAEALVDLYAVVRQGLRISKGSYSIKKLEAFYWGGIRGSGDQPDDVADAMSSVIAYERWLVEGGDGVLDSIAAYNRDDVRSTHDLHAWLEERRAELEAVHGPQHRPTFVAPPAPGLTEAEQREADTVEALRAAGHPLMAGLVGWHRRESKPQWWDYFRIGDLTDEELLVDGAALGSVGPPESLGPLPKPSRSTRWRYPFPAQETKFRIGDVVTDVRTRASLGKILAIDPDVGWIDLTRGNGKAPATPTGLGPDRPIPSAAHQSSLQRTAAAMLAGEHPLGQLLLDRVAPTDLVVRPGENPGDVVVRAGLGLRDAVLAVQGPPGSGKTYAGAQLIRALLDDGRRVGVTAQSHAVIVNLLRGVGRPALHKGDSEQHCQVGEIKFTDDNAAIAAALAGGTHNLIGGTSWLWAREDMADSVDVLVIDEAGQFSLANAVAVAPAARGLVLLGDPQQLTQPTQALHPDGAGVSALEYLLDGLPTIPEDRGVFLDQTYRMHPDLTAVVSELMYEGRLRSAPGRENQRLNAPAPWDGTGVRWRPVEHLGNDAVSVEEVAVVRGILAELVTATWTDCDGAAHPMTLADVLIVAPYNAHVGRLRAALPAGARIGTVDKFQGQEAPVVIFTMASSSAADAPRGIGFLYDLHRLNVAISRARCVAIIVGSPALLDAPVNSPEQLRAVNGLIAASAAAG